MNAGIQIAGWTLLSFLWQGAVIGVAAAVALRLARRSGPSVRYTIGCIGLGFMLALPMLTAWALATAAAAEPGTPVMSRVLQPRNAGSDRIRIGRGESGASAWSGQPSLPAARTIPDRWLASIVALWIIGVLILTTRMAGGWWRVLRLHSSALRTPASPWTAAAERLATRLGAAGVVHVVETACVDAPAVVGWLRPVILLPVAALANLSPLQVDAILAHEIAHIRRHDYVVNLLQSLAETLLFYHPAVWWISARIRAEREHCCDDVALAVCGDPMGYAEALADIESSRSAPALALGAAGGSLLQRIQRILGEPVSSPPRTNLIAPVLLGMALAAGSAVSVTTIELPAVPTSLRQTSHAPSAAPIPQPLASAPAQTAPPARPAPPAPPAPASQPAPPAPPAPPPSAPASQPAPPAPPAPLPSAPASPPAPPAPPAPPPPIDDRVRRERSGGLVRDSDVRVSGQMTFTPDLTDVASMTAGASLILRERNWFTVRTVEVRGEGGAISRRFYVSGVEQPWEPDGRRYLAERLPSLIRRSGLAAAERTRQIMNARGVDGVLAEITLLESDYARRLYFRELFAAVPADRVGPPLVARAAALAADTIRSDYELRETLETMAPHASADAVSVKAYVDATATIGSDFEHRQALQALIDAPGFAPSAVDAVARSAAAIGSDFEKRQVLSALAHAAGTAAEAGKAILDAAATIRSDYECATLLLEFTRERGIPDGLAASWAGAVHSIGSDYEKGRVLKAAARGRPLAPDTLQAVLEAVGTMRSDYEQAEALLEVARTQSIDPASRSAFVAAADGIQSEYEQNRVLAALVRAEKR